MAESEQPTEDGAESLPQTKEIDEKLSSALGEVLPDEEERAQVISRISTFVKHEVKIHAGPLPPPEQLADYDKVHAGFALRIFEMAEKQQNHGIEMDVKLSDAGIEDRVKITDAAIADQKRGMVFGALLLLVILVCALTSGLYDKTAVAGFFLGAAVLNAIGLFVHGRNNGDSNEQE